MDQEEIFREKKKLIMQFLFEKYRVLPLLSTIAVAGLAFFSSSTGLIHDIYLFKIALAILASLVPLSILTLLLVIHVEISGLIWDLNTRNTELKDETTLRGVLKKMLFKIKERKFKDFLRELLRLYVIVGVWLLWLILTVGFILFILSLFNIRN